MGKNTLCKAVLCGADCTVIYIDESFSKETGISAGDRLDLNNAGREEDGSYLICDEKIRLWRVKTESFDGYAGYYRDNKKLVELVTKLENKNKEMSAILDQSYDGIVVADSQGRFITINDSYFKISGIDKAEVLGRTAQEIVDNGTISDSATLYVLKFGKSVTFNQIFKTGRQSIVSGNPVYDDENRLIAVVTNVRDLTEVNELRQQLADSETKLRHYSEIVQTLSAKNHSNINLVYKSKPMHSLLDAALKYAGVDAPILITGESGVGKEVITDFIHQNGSRKDAPFLKINCGAIPEELLESELFGYEGGAFTGAQRSGKQGLFELADKGDILLDEIGELPMRLQVKLLRFVQHKEFYRVGGNKLVKVDVRIIAATNRDLAKMVAEKAFRSDLFYRLDVLKINIPPLRERMEDVIPLTEFFLARYNAKYSMNKSIATSAYKCMLNYGWSGNVRELENLMERLILTCESDIITAGDLPEDMRPGGPEGGADRELTYREAREAFEKRFLISALNKHKTARNTAKALGVDHSTIVKKAAKYNIGLKK